MVEPLSVSELRAAIEGGATFDYLCFWGHRASKSGEVTAACLSQWWPAPFSVGGKSYRTAEHFMMAGKARLFGDAEMEAAILEAGTPDVAKKLGRRVRGFDDARWDEARFDIVCEGSLAKFTQNPRLAEFLRATTPKVLVEASPLDRIWGIGLAASDARATIPDEWPGLNLLGFALMAARAALAKSPAGSGSA